MKNLICVLIACVLVACVSVSFGQCPNGQCPNGQCPLLQGAAPSTIPQSNSEKYILQYRNDQAKLNEQLAGSVNGITAAVNQNSQLLNELIQLEKGKAAAAPASAVPPVAPVLPPKLEEAKEKADAVLQSPVVQHIVAFIAIVGLVLLGRAVYLKCHADKDKIAALLPDGARKQFLALDDFNTKLYEDLRGRHYDSEAKLSEVQDNLVKVALATPAPSQVAPASVPPVTK